MSAWGVGEAVAEVDFQDAARKLLYLTIQNAQHNWRHAYNWSAALAALKIHFGDRLPDTPS